jgi:hypothetical protein
MTRALVLAFALAVIAMPPAGAAAAKPDAHDRAVARELDAKVKTFKEVATKTGGSKELQRALDSCPLLKKDPGQAFAALFALLPVLLIELVNDYGPQLRAVRSTVRSLHPHSSLFRKWLAAEGKSFDLILRFDNHGKKIDVCEAATVMLDKKTTAADVKTLLGIDPSLIAVLFQSPSSTTLTKLNPKMRAFFVAAGLPKADAKALTS